MNRAGRGLDCVIGHYVNVEKSSDHCQPLLDESSALFKAVVTDDCATVQTQLKADPSQTRTLYIILYWGLREETDDDCGGYWRKTDVVVKQRTLLMLAAYHGSVRVVCALIENGSLPGQRAPDGVSALQTAISGKSANMVQVLQYLHDYALPQGDKSTRGEKRRRCKGYCPGGLPDVTQCDQAMANEPPFVAFKPLNPFKRTAGGASALSKPQFTTDHFRMFCFKILPCVKRKAHDWRLCPYAHETENARRRDPRIFRYCTVPCPDYKRGICLRGNGCQYAHGVYEMWLHPSRYRTRMCQDGEHCDREVCFFAHHPKQLRKPTHNWAPPEECEASDPAMDIAAFYSSTNAPPSNVVESGGHGMFAPRVSKWFARRCGLEKEGGPIVSMGELGREYGGSHLGSCTEAGFKADLLNSEGRSSQSSTRSNSHQLEDFFPAATPKFDELPSLIFGNEQMVAWPASKSPLESVSASTGDLSSCSSHSQNWMDILQPSSFFLHHQTTSGVLGVDDFDATPQNLKDDFSDDFFVGGCQGVRSIWAKSGCSLF